jgi:pimeloyl-ACP methyl ester carboxylesterase
MLRLIIMVAAGAALVGCAGEPRIVERTAVSPDGVPIHYLAGGRGAPALVFIHGWSCDAGYWREQLPVFMKTHRVVAVDLAGHGGSGEKRERFTMDAFGADVAAVVAAEGLDRVVLIGHSMGGPVALEAARRLPGKVALVVGVDTLQDVEMRWPEEEFKRIRDDMVRDFPGATRSFVRAMFRDDADPALVASITADMAAAPPRVAISAIEELRDFDEAEAMRLAGVPVVCINAGTWPTHVDVNRRHAPAFDAVVIEGVGHFLMLERPKEFNDALSHVLAGRR